MEGLAPNGLLACLLACLLAKPHGEVTFYDSGEPSERKLIVRPMNFEHVIWSNHRYWDSTTRLYITEHKGCGRYTSRCKDLRASTYYEQGSIIGIKGFEARGERLRHADV